LAALNLAQPGASLAAGLIRAGVALIAAHTIWTPAAWSVSHALAEACGLTVEEPLAPRPGREGAPATGLGLIARPPRPMTAEALAAHVREALGLEGVRFSGPAGRKVKRVAVCSGSGGSLLGLAAVRAEAMLTGEINHHQGIEAHQRKLAVIEAGHFESEVVVVRPLAERLAADEALRAAGVEVRRRMRFSAVPRIQ
jgi:putative NIF3 family GTP cyclohydrolase 1 type 2